MKKQGYGLILIISASFMTGCMGTIWTGASLVYDRHNVYKQLSDYKISANVYQALNKNNFLKESGSNIDLAVFNGDVLAVGNVATVALREEIFNRISDIEGYRRIINQIQVGHYPSSSVDDSWITAKIRSSIFADSEIDPHLFKVVTSNRVVYLMGDVKSEQAVRVINIARNTTSVERVVNLLKIYELRVK